MLQYLNINLFYIKERERYFNILILSVPKGNFMFIFEKTYDFREMTKNNMHTHTNFSTCAKPEMVLRDMVKEAERCNIETLAITDHSNLDDGIDVGANTLILRKQLEEIDTNVRVLIGSELSCYGIGKFSEPYEVNQALDYRNYSCTHYHCPFWDHPEDRSPRGYAKDMLDLLYSLFETDRADCIAHPFNPSKLKFFSDEEKNAVHSALTDNELGDVMQRGEEAGCAWEVHWGSFISYPDFQRRFFNIGKEVGVHFNFGTDAHNLASLDTRSCAERLEAIVAGK